MTVDMMTAFIKRSSAPATLGLLCCDSKLTTYPCSTNWRSVGCGS